MLTTSKFESINRRASVTWERMDSDMLAVASKMKYTDTSSSRRWRQSSIPSAIASCRRPPSPRAIVAAVTSWCGKPAVTQTSSASFLESAAKHPPPKPPRSAREGECLPDPRGPGSVLQRLSWPNIWSPNKGDPQRDVPPPPGHSERTKFLRTGPRGKLPFHLPMTFHSLRIFSRSLATRSSRRSPRSEGGCWHEHTLCLHRLHTWASRTLNLFSNIWWLGCWLKLHLTNK